jgi:hypothetical protein
MTFVLATAWPELALLAVDTRLRLKDTAGALLGFADTGAKLGTSRDGWWSASGDYALQELLAPLAADETAAALPALLAAHGVPFMGRLEPAIWAATMREQQRVLVVSRNGAGFRSLELDWRGQPRDDDPGYCCTRAVKPVGLGRARFDELIDLFHRDARELRGDRAALLRRVGALFARIYAETGAEGCVSADVEVGLISHAGCERLGPMPHAALGQVLIRATEQDGSTKKSDAYNPQGSVLPTPVDFTFSYNSNAGGASSSAGLAVTWTAGKIYRPDGSTITVPASSSITAAPTPALSQVAGGALGARTRFVRIAYFKIPPRGGTWLYAFSAEASLAVNANNLLKVTAPTAVAGYDGWVVLVGSASNAEMGQGAGDFNHLTFGSDWTEPTAGATVTDTTCPFNANWVGAVVNGYLPFATQEFLYPYWDLAFTALQPNGIGMIVNSGPANAAVNVPNAQDQQSDGHIAVVLRAPSTGAQVTGYITATTAAQSTTSNGAGLGGKF